MGTDGIHALRRLMLWVGVTIAAALVCWAAFVVIFGNASAKGFATLGMLGDSMAPVAVLAAAAALFVSAYSLLLQREDIDQQIREMQNSVEAQRELGALQKEDMRRRTIEAVFREATEFQLMVERDVQAALDSYRHCQRIAISPIVPGRGQLSADAHGDLDRYERLYSGVDELARAALSWCADCKLQAARILAHSDTWDNRSSETLLQELAEKRKQWYSDIVAISQPE